MDPCSAGSFLRASALHEMDSCSNESPKKKATPTTRCTSTTLMTPNYKVRRDMKVEQSTLRRSAACSFRSQLNFQWDAVQTVTNCHATNPNLVVPKTRAHVEFVPAFIM
jgi:hypothetical protein